METKNIKWKCFISFKNCIAKSLYLRNFSNYKWTKYYPNAILQAFKLWTAGQISSKMKVSNESNRSFLGMYLSSLLRESICMRGDNGKGHCHHLSPSRDTTGQISTRCMSQPHVLTDVSWILVSWKFSSKNICTYIYIYIIY